MTDSPVIIQSIHDFENYVSKSWSNVYILVDENTQEHCLPRLFENLDFFSEAEILVVEPYETSKQIEIAYQLWGAMLETGADRQSLLVNLGGGMITDLGGFIASTFKRGIDFIHMPTTLLGQVDASIGGKTGINFEGYKNQIGTFSFPVFTYIDSAFLSTLPQKEFLSGLGEVIKYGLIADAEIIDILLKGKLDDNLNKLLNRCISIKKEIVAQDPFEQNVRKKLNFGHTVGHAIEKIKQGSLLHGESVAYGMLCESYISYQKGMISVTILEKIEQVIDKYFSPLTLSKEELEEAILAMSFDKKNTGKKINFTLLEGIGKAAIDQTAEEEMIKKSLEKYFL